MNHLVVLHLLEGPVVCVRIDVVSGDVICVCMWEKAQEKPSVGRRIKTARAQMARGDHVGGHGTYRDDPTK